MNRIRKQMFIWLALSIVICLVSTPQRDAHAEAPASAYALASSPVQSAPDVDANDDIEGLDGDGQAFDLAAPAITNSATDNVEDATGAQAVSIDLGVASDDVLRMQLRLCALGYRLASVTGVSDASDQAALDAFVRQNPPQDGVTAISALFSPDAALINPLGASANAESDFAPLTYLTGLSLPWSDVRQRLSPDVSYPLTLSTSGIVFHMRYLEGDGHAEMLPELAWDDATLINQLNAQDGGDKLPVVLSIGALHIAASISRNPFVEPDANGMHRYCLYFTDSGSHLCNLIDAEHQQVIAIAADKEA